ncbi:acyltransferase [Erythrobacter sp. JK5]|uniref:acyltransferase family protein n=1 Tax=Erythrobacter sp. JK5 TaxID=2829500 RepID=UPI001BA9B5FE|nr:acyltransferase [Erythrobacter sp. JK5]QUL36732.1 acyltransferase [Erythrobacter sp. JK5]
MQDSGGNYFSFAKQAYHNPWLDLLRSLAIFLVLLRHGAVIENTGPPEGALSNFFLNGWAGVDLFFVLSGYLIASGLIRRFGATRSLFPVGYFKDRILRIVPAYYAVLLLCLLGFFPGFRILSEDPGTSFVAHLLFLQDYTGSDINVVFWSLGVEEKFYIIAPVLVLLLLKAGSWPTRLALAAGILLVSPLGRGLTFEAIDQPVAYFDFFHAMRSPFHMSLEGFVVGIVVAMFRANGRALSRTLALAGLCISAIVLVLWLGSHDFYADITRIDAWLQPTALALLFGVMLLCAASLAGEELKFEPFFRVNARLSYALYLVHFPLIPLAFALGKAQHPLIFWGWYLLVAYAAALVLHFGVEKPFLNLKQRLNARASPAPPAAQTEVASP